MQCNGIIYEDESGEKKIQCHADAEFSVKLGSVWGHYCGNHALSAVESEGETMIKSYEPEEAEESEK